MFFCGDGGISVALHHGYALSDASKTVFYESPRQRQALSTPFDKGVKDLSFAVLPNDRYSHTHPENGCLPRCLGCELPSLLGPLVKGGRIFAKQKDGGFRRVKRDRVAMGHGRILCDKTLSVFACGESTSPKGRGKKNKTKTPPLVGCP